MTEAGYSIEATLSEIQAIREEHLRNAPNCPRRRGKVCAELRGLGELIDEAIARGVGPFERLTIGSVKAP